ncbi:hypothetical protein N7532_006324 [Penicillium argentinense]|uniref:Cellular morphogenesis protein n=1 Tax=Penicillium argentinense TaxID=1131581 RepID=A0A9W9FFL1_9EURO|nr:uncharacterized protein N7532_006324 [Penicillium argentinense]KAJ5099323.1 hypothetical protein N7532_006324 [Penicillium argentinense]
MRVSSLYGSAAAGLSTLLALSLANSAHALSFDAVSIPDLDLSTLGRVTITGDFDGVSLYEYEGQSEITQRTGSSILTPLPNGILTNLTSADAQIRDMCSFTKKDGTFAGIFVGGNFTTLGGVDSPGAALFNPNSSKVTALSGLKGSVSAVLCDQNTNRVYVGGSFSHKNTSNALAWSPDDGWTDLPFDGLNGPVESILKTDDGHIVWGGSFDGLGNSTSSSKHGKQVLNLQNATITSDTDSSLSGYSDNRNIICSTSGEAAKGSTYLLHDNAPGFWRADLGFNFNPTKVRLYNTHLDGRGTKTFLFRALPDNGIMNMTYIDQTGKKQACDQSCPLSDSTSEKYRDFTLVNSVGMQGFEIEFLTWYGAGAGLNGIEVFQDQIVTYAVDTYNEPSCAGIEYPATATRTGSWTIESGGYLSAQVTDANDDDTSVVFKPDIKESGNYTVKIYTPGCVEDNSCSKRGMVNVTATLATDSDEAQPSPTTIYQTNNYEKYDTLFSGYVDAASDSFRPTVTLQPIVGQGDITVVASRVRFELLNATKTSDDLNGLYDFDPSSKKIDADKLDKSDINKAGNSLKHDAAIKSLSSNDGVVYIAGNFSDSKIHNIMSITDGKATALSGGGLNSQVLATTSLDKTLYVGGQFTDTSDGGAKGLNYVASYSSSSKQWSALGNGVNGHVNTIYPLELNVSSTVNETTIAVSGDFNKILASGDKSDVFVPGFAIWIPSQKAWLQTLNDTQMEFAGRLSAVTDYNNTSILAGSLATDGINAGGVVSLEEDDDDLNLISLSMKLNHAHTKSGSQPSAGVLTGVYDIDSDRNLTILGGQFATTASNGSTVENVVFVNGTQQTLSGLPQGLQNNATTVMSLLVHNDTLYVGGNLTGSIDGDDMAGLVTYDLTKNEFSQDQPWSLRGDSVVVNSIAKRPGSSDIFVGGDFESAGSLPCETVCKLDSTENSWSWPAMSISGTVIALKWASSNTLYAAGDLKISDNETVIATFDNKKEIWTAFEGASKSAIPGNLTAFAPASEDVSEFWIAGTAKNGSAFFMNYDGSDFKSPGNLFSKGTVIRGMEVLPTNQNHESVSLLNDDQILLIMGQLIIPDFGNASAALYNGTAVTPFILSSKSNGQPGSMAHLFSENQNPYTSGSESHHSNGIVVLVSFCCALGCVFLIVAAGVILNKIQRRRQGYAAAPQTFGTDRPTDMTRLPPEYLFNSLGHTNPTAPAI